jgi:hypothetical protein
MWIQGLFVFFKKKKKKIMFVTFVGNEIDWLDLK